MRLKNHKGFTLVEIAIVVVIVGVILTIIPLRLQSLRTHTDLSLVMQQREDLWQRSVTKMRQGHIYSSASIEVSTGVVQVFYSGGSSTGLTETLQLPSDTSIQGPSNLTWVVEPYAIGCVGYDSGFAIVVGKLRSCYRVDLTSCALLHEACQ